MLRRIWYFSRAELYQTELLASELAKLTQHKHTVRLPAVRLNLSPAPLRCIQVLLVFSFLMYLLFNLTSLKPFYCIQESSYDVVQHT